jgi:hypothetical protein
MLSCYEGSDFGHAMPCPHCTGHWQMILADGRFLPEPSQNQGCLQPAQQIMKTTAGPFHFLHMGPMSHKCFLWLILSCPVGTVAGQYFGRWQSSARAKPKPRLFEAPSTADHENHCRTISFSSYEANESCYHAMKALI